MDTGRKNKSHPVFEVFQAVRIDGSTLRITRIGKHFVVSAVATAGTESGRNVSGATPSSRERLFVKPQRRAGKGKKHDHA